MGYAPQKSTKQGSSKGNGKDPAVHGGLKSSKKDATYHGAMK